MMSMQSAPAQPSAMSRALARDRLGVPSVLAFILASIAPMTVCAGVIPTAYAVTGLTGIPVAFLVVAVVLALFCAGYVAMSRRIRNAGAFYAFVAAGLGKVPGVAAALMALVAYESFELPRVFRTGNLRLIHAASCPFRYSSMTSCGVR
jgi:amino acid transporter